MTSFETRLLLVRHGRPQAPDEKKRFLGQSDWPLSPEGLEQAEKLREELSGTRWDGVFVSPLRRARETLIPFQADNESPVAVLPALKEIDLGEWDGRPGDELRQAFPSLFDERGRDLYRFVPPGGESFEDLARRCVPPLRHILNSPGCWLVVAHAGVFRVFLHEVLGIPFMETFSLDPGYGESLAVGRVGDKVVFQGEEYPLSPGKG